MCRTKPNKQMHMVGDATYALGNSIRRANDSAQVRVQVAAPCWFDYGFVIFCSENNMIMKAQMCR